MTDYIKGAVEKMKYKFYSMSAARRERFFLATIMLVWALVLVITPEETLDRIWWAVIGIFRGK